MIYFVEDDASIRELVTYTLNNTGLPAEGYDRPSAFWTAMGQNKPKLILLDIMLPEEDGMVILRKLRADPATRAIPVMMLTAISTSTTIRPALVTAFWTSTKVLVISMGDVTL